MRRLFGIGVLLTTFGLLAGCGGGGGGGASAAVASVFTGSWAGGSNTIPVSSVGQIVNAQAPVDDAGSTINAVWTGSVDSAGNMDGVANLPSSTGSVTSWRITGFGTLDPTGHWKGTLTIWTTANQPVITFDLTKQ